MSRQKKTVNVRVNPLATTTKAAEASEAEVASQDSRAHPVRSPRHFACSRGTMREGERNLNDMRIAIVAIARSNSRKCNCVQLARLTAIKVEVKGC